MNSELEKGIEEQEAFRLEISGKIREMIVQNVPLHEIVAMFGAEDFLIEEKRGKHTSIRFNVDGFVNNLIANNEFLKCPDKTFKDNNVFITPCEGEIKTGSGEGMKEGEIIPRSKYLMQVLHELNERYIMGSGENSSNMKRKFSYQIFLIPGLERMVLVNNEKGEATYIYYHDAQKVVEEEGHKSFKKMTDEEIIEFGIDFITDEDHAKEQLRTMNDRVSVYEWPKETKEVKSEEDKEKKWKKDVKELITHPITEKEEEKKKGEESKFVPDDWKTVHGLADSLNTTYRRIKRLVSRFEKENSDWIKSRKAKIGNTFSYISPELQAIIIDTIKEQKKLEEKYQRLKSEGWVTKRELREEIKTGYGLFKEELESQRGERLDCFEETYFNGRSQELVSPLLVKEVKEKLKSHLSEETYENHTIIPVLARRLGVDREKIERLAEEFNKDHDWIKYKGRSKIRYYSSELVDLIVKKVESQRVSDDWVNIPNLVKRFNTDRSKILRLAEVLSNGNPKLMKETSGREIRFAPELVDLIEKEINEQVRAPEGWFTIGTLAVKNHVDWGTIADRARKYKESNPEWFEKYLTDKNVLREHLSPELVAIIEKDLKK